MELTCSPRCLVVVPNPKWQNVISDIGPFRITRSRIEPEPL